MAAKLEISTVEAEAGIKRLEGQIKELVAALRDVSKVTSGMQGVQSKAFKTIGSDMQRVARSQQTMKKATDQSTAAAIRQANTVNRNRQAVLDLTASLTKLGGQEANVKKLKTAFDVYTRSVQRAKGDTTKLNNAQLDLTNTLKKVRREVRTAEKGAKGLSRTMRNLGSTAIFALGPLSGVGARIVAFGAIASRVGFLTAGLAAGFAGLAVGATALVKAIIRTNLELTRVRSALGVASDSAAEAARTFREIKEIAAELGSDFKSSALQFAQFAVAARDSNISTEQAKKVFVAVSKASVALGLTTDQTTGAFRALQQMMSKGTVQAEELRGQLGERIPGAFGLAARAIGVTTRELGKMLEQGEVLADDLVPKIGREFELAFGQQAEIAAAGLTASINRLTTAVTGLFDTLDASTSTSAIFLAFLESATEAANNLELLIRKDPLKEIEKFSLARRKRPELIEDVENLKKALKDLEGFTLSPTKILDKIFAVTATELETTEKALRINADILKNTLKALQRAGVNVEALRAIPGLPEDTGAPLPTGRGRSADALAGFRDVVPGRPKDIIEEAEKITKARQALEGQNDVLRLQIRGLDEQAENLKVRNKLEAKYGEVILPSQLNNLIAINAEQRRLKDINEATRDLRSAVEDNNILRMRLDGLNDEADALQIRNKLEKEFARLKGTDLLNNLIEELILNKKLTAELKAQEAIRKKSSRSASRARLMNEELVLETEALRKGTHALEKLNEEFARNDAIAQYAKLLSNMSDEMKATVADLQEFTRNLDDNIEAFKQYEDIIKPLEDFFARTFDKIGDSIVEAFERGSISLKNLADLGDSILKDLFKTVFDALVLKPLKEKFFEVLGDLFPGLGDILGGGEKQEVAAQVVKRSVVAKMDVGVLNAGIGGSTLVGGAGGDGLGGGILGGILGGLLGGGGTAAGPAAGGIGNASFESVLSSPNLAVFGKGGITRGPTTFFQPGGFGLAGESGPEGIVPLKRTSSGNLGVEVAGGGGGGNTFIFQFPENTNVRDFADSQSQLAAMVAGTVGAASASNN